MAVKNKAINDLEQPADDVSELLQYPNYCTCCDLEIPFGIVLCDDCERDSEAFEPECNFDNLILESRQKWRDALVRVASCPNLRAQAIPPHVESAYDTVYADEMRAAVQLVSSGDIVPEIRKWKQELGQAIDADQVTRNWRPARRESAFFRFALVAMILMTLVPPSEAHEEDYDLAERIGSYGWAIFPFVLTLCLWNVSSSLTQTLSVMAKYAKLGFVVQCVTAGCTVLTSAVMLFKSLGGSLPFLRNEALPARKANKFGVIASMILACLMFVVAPLWGCTKAFKKFEPIMRVLEKLPYVTWFMEWVGNYLEGNADLDDIPDDIRDLKKSNPFKQQFPWRTNDEAKELMEDHSDHDVDTCSDKGKCRLGECLCKCHVEDEYEIFKDFDMAARCDNKDIQAQRGGLGSSERSPYQELVDVAHQLMHESTDARIQRWKRYYHQAKRADPEKAATIIERFIFRYPWMSFLKDDDIDEEPPMSSEVRSYEDAMTDLLLTTHYMCVDKGKDLKPEVTHDHPLKSESGDDHLGNVGRVWFEKYGGLPFLRFYDPLFGTTTEINPPCHWPRKFKDVCVDSFWRTLGFGESTAKEIGSHVKRHHRKYALGATGVVALLGVCAYLLSGNDDTPIWEDEASKGKTKSRRTRFKPGVSRPDRRERDRKPWSGASSGSEDEVGQSEYDDLDSRFDRYQHGVDTGAEVGYSREGLSAKDKLLESLLTPAEFENIKALRKLRKPTPPKSDIRHFFKPVTKKTVAETPIHTLDDKSVRAVNSQLPRAERVDDPITRQHQASTPANLKKKSAESEALLGKEKINFSEHLSRVYQFRLDDKMVSSATVISDKVVIPIHALKGNEDGTPSICNFSGTAILKKKYVEVAPDLAVILHHGAVQTKRGAKLRAPENEMVFVLGFNKGDQNEATAGVGHCTRDGTYTAQTLPGDCGGPVIAVKDGAVVGFHIAGSEFMNKFIPITEELATKLKTPSQVIESSLFH